MVDVRRIAEVGEKIKSDRRKKINLRKLAGGKKISLKTLRTAPQGPRIAEQTVHKAKKQK